MVRYYDYTMRQIISKKSLQKELKLCFYVATPTSSLVCVVVMVGGDPAEVSHTHVCWVNGN